MAGGERVRFCAHCHLHVHNLSEITPREAMQLVLRSGGRLCLRIEHDHAGTPRTRALAEPLYQIKRRASRMAAGAFGAALTLCTSARADAAHAEPSGGTASLVGTVTALWHAIATKTTRPRSCSPTAHTKTRKISKSEKAKVKTANSAAFVIIR
jgi:hypothetical protein